MKPPDILITPTRPISASWNLSANTLEGNDFLNNYYPSRTVEGCWLGNLKRELGLDGLTHKTNWDCVVLERVDP